MQIRTVVRNAIGLVVLVSAIAGIVGHAPGAASAAAAGRADAKHKASRDGWPETPAGAMARQWVVAFSTSEDAMRGFLKQNVSEQSLAKRGIAQRVESYRKMRERYGRLMLASVLKEEKDELTANLMASDGSTHKFVFTVEANPPHKLRSVGIVQKGFGHGGSWFHH